MDRLLNETLTYFIEHIIVELDKELDWRAKGYGKNPLQRASIYMSAMVRDIIRIPLHHPAGIAQARFRGRIDYIRSYVIPTLQFFQTRYPLSEAQRATVGEAADLLESSIKLLSDGTIPEIDDWYATMDEFYEVTEYSRRAAEKLKEVTEKFAAPVGDAS